MSLVETLPLTAVFATVLVKSLTAVGQLFKTNVKVFVSEHPAGVVPTTV
jgi:hypothetical protein